MGGILNGWHFQTHFLDATASHITLYKHKCTFAVWGFISVQETIVTESNLLHKLLPVHWYSFSKVYLQQPVFLFRLLHLWIHGPNVALYSQKRKRQRTLSNTLLLSIRKRKTETAENYTVGPAEYHLHPEKGSIQSSPMWRYSGGGEAVAWTGNKRGECKIYFACLRRSRGGGGEDRVGKLVLEWDRVLD